MGPWDPQAKILEGPTPRGLEMGPIIDVFTFYSLEILRCIPKQDVSS